MITMGKSTISSRAVLLGTGLFFTVATLLLSASGSAFDGGMLPGNASPLDGGVDGGIAELSLMAVDAGAPAAEAATGTDSDGATLEWTLAEDHRPVLKLSVTPSEGAIGDPIEWKLEVRRRVGDRVHLSSGASFGGLDLHSKENPVGEPDGEWVVETLLVRLISFETGDFEIPSQKLTVVDSQGNMGEIRTEEATVRINSLVANEPDPQIKPDTGPGVPVVVDDYTLLYVLGAIGAIALVALLTLLGRKLWSMRRPRPGPPPPPPRPAEEIALEKLDLLKSSTYLDEGLIKLYHVFLSEAFREYLGNRYRFDSLELSTEELLGQLRARDVQAEIYRRSLGLLTETDFVKFAKYLPSIEESRNMLNEAFDVVHVTTPSRIVEPIGKTPGEGQSAKIDTGDTGGAGG